MKNTLLVGLVAALIAGAALFSYETIPSGSKLFEFEEFKQTYGKTYTLE